MGYNTIEGLAAGLFVYVMTTILLGGINWLFKVVSDDAILALGAFLALATFFIARMRRK